MPKITDYLRAGNPCLFLPSAEEVSVEETVKTALKELEDEGKEPTDYAVWRVTTGLKIFEAGHYDSLPRTGPKDLIPSLQEIEKSITPLVAIFFNVRFHLDSPAVVQQIADTVNKVRSTFSAVILAGPYIELPPELHDVVTFCDFPLPTQKQLEQQFTTLIKEYLPDLTNFPASAPERRAKIKKAAMNAAGLTALAAENALSLSLSMTGGVDTSIIQQQKEQDIRKSDILEYISTSESISTLGGFRALKAWLQRRKAGFTDEAREFGLSYPKGILLVGAGGVGKTLCGKVAAAYLELPLLRLDMGRVYSAYVGSSEARIRSALKIAEAVSPCLLLVDELEKGLAGLQGSGTFDSGVTARVIATLLTWRQETTKPVFLVGTVNDPSKLPPMVYRRGRFDEIWSVGLPDAEERVEILGIHLTKRKQDPALFDLVFLANRSNGYTGAELESCIEDAMFTAFSGGKKLETEHIMYSIQSTKPQSNIDNEEAQQLAEWMHQRARSVSMVSDYNVMPLRKGEKDVKNKK